MTQIKLDQEAAEPAVQDAKCRQQSQNLEFAISRARLDASAFDLMYDDEVLVKHLLTQASKLLASVASDPEKQEEHLQAGFNYVGKVRVILGSAAQSHDFKRY